MYIGASRGSIFSSRTRCASPPSKSVVNISVKLAAPASSTIMATAAALVRRIDGSPSNVIGLPMAETVAVNLTGGQRAFSGESSASLIAG